MLKRIWIAGALSLAIASTAASPALGSTSAGELGAPISCSKDSLLFNDDPPAAVSSAGVVTSFTSVSPGPGATLDFVMVDALRTEKVLGATGVRTFTAPAGGLQTFGVSPGIPVQPGDEVAVWVGPNGGPCHLAQGSGGDDGGFTTEPQAGDSMNPPYAGVNGAPDAVATVEPDADGDGYGDETQDSCPTDPTVHSGGCTADVALAQTLTPARVAPGETAVATLAVTNLSSQPASPVAVDDILPANLDLVGAPPACAGAPHVTCTIGTLGPHAQVVVSLTLRPTVAGVFVNSATVSSDHDPSAANNSATATLTVAAPRSCIVPRLEGRSMRQARHALIRAHCRLGYVVRPSRRQMRDRHAHRLVVGRSDPRRRTVLPAGTRVAVTLVPARR